MSRRLADLGFKVQAGKQAKGRAAAALGIILCGAGLEVFWDAPMVGVDPLDDAGAAQRLQPSHVALDIGVVVAAWHADAAGLGHGAVQARDDSCPSRRRGERYCGLRDAASRAGPISTIDPSGVSSAVPPRLAGAT